jgi:hypothetical protein
MSAGDWALLILAVFWAILVIFSALVLVNLYRVLASTKDLVDGMRWETVSLLQNARSTVLATNRNLGETERLVSSAANITGTVERVTKLVEMAVETPLIKIISASYGTAQALRRFRGET